MARVSNRVPNHKSKSGGSKRNNGRKNNLKRGDRELLFAEDCQHYARVLTRHGDGRFDVLCIGDGQTRLAHVRGKLWKRVWVQREDLVLVCLRTWQDNKVDIVHKFSEDEERALVRAGEVARVGMGRAPTENGGHEAFLQRERDVHGASRVGFIPTEDEVVFGYEDEGD